MLVVNCALIGEIDEARAALAILKRLQPDVSLRWIAESVLFTARGSGKILSKAFVWPGSNETYATRSHFALVRRRVRHGALTMRLRSHVRSAVKTASWRAFAAVDTFGLVWLFSSHEPLMPLPRPAL